MEILIIAVIVGAVVFGGLGSWVSYQKGRGEGEGLALGCLFGPFGVLIEALLPTGTPPAVPSVKDKLRMEREVQESHRLAEESRRQRRADRLARADAVRASAAEHWREAQEWWRSRRSQDRDWFKARGVEPGPMAWFKVLPDWFQAIFMGLILAAVVLFVVLILSGKL